uniref:Uncharacterized protein n=1 Tax=Pseudomonas phage Nican01 TaxID=3138540 RepID=A0AAU6W0E9_9CAUD
MRLNPLAYAIHVAFQPKQWPVPHHLKQYNWMNIQ